MESDRLPEKITMPLLIIKPDIDYLMKPQRKCFKWRLSSIFISMFTVTAFGIPFFFYVILYPITESVFGHFHAIAGTKRIKTILRGLHFIEHMISINMIPVNKRLRPDFI